MSGRKAKEARRTGEVISLEARRAEQAFAADVRRRQAATKEEAIQDLIVAWKRYESCGERRRALTRRVLAVSGLVLAFACFALAALVAVFG